MSGGSSTGVLVTEARRSPVLPVASGSAARLSADWENVDDAKYQAGKDGNATSGPEGSEVLAGGGGARPVTISDGRPTSSVIPTMATTAARPPPRPRHPMLPPPNF